MGKKMRKKSKKSFHREILEEYFFRIYRNQIEYVYGFSVDGSAGISEGQLAEALAHMKRCPSKLTLALRKVMAAHPQNAWVHADRIFSHLKEVLDPSTPQQVQELFNRVWFRLNAVFPRKLWALTANHLNHVSGIRSGH